MKKVFSLLHPLLLFIVLSLAQAEDKPTVRGWLGIYATNLARPFRIALNVENGVLVTGVVKNSPAEKAGIVVGDVILKLADKEIYRRSDLIKLVRAKPKERVEIELLRKGKTIKISVVLGELKQTKFDIKILEQILKRIEKYLTEIPPQLRKKMEWFKQFKKSKRV